MDSKTHGKTMNKNAKLPNRQTFVNPAGIGTKSEVFGIFVSEIYLLSAILTLPIKQSANIKSLMTTTKSIILFLTMTLVNIALTFILISILADGLLQYKTGFYFLAPFILGFILFIFYFLINQTIKFRKRIISSNNYSWTIGFVFINILILLFNCYCWIDLFDGTTDTMLP
jgi:hypothetical protein